MGGRAVVALAAGVLALAGCSSGTGSQAATSDVFEVPMSVVSAEVSQASTALGQPAEQPPAGLAPATVERLVQTALVDAKAADLGLTLTNGQIEEGLNQLAEQNGGMAALEDLALQQGLRPESLKDVVRTNLLVTAIGLRLNQAGDAAAQGQAAQQALSEYSSAVDVQVAPRYGTWDDAQLRIVPGSPVVTPAAATPAQP